VTLAQLNRKLADAMKDGRLHQERMVQKS
jgi:hypothetical protein